jgi:hypothetical protein
LAEKLQQRNKQSLGLFLA